MKQSDQHLLPPPPEQKLITDGSYVKRTHIHPWWLVLIGLLVLGAIFLIGFLPRHKREKVVEEAASRQAHLIPSANAVKVKVSPSLTTLLLPGNVTPLTEAYIYARATGYVRTRYADIGDHVRKGQLLADIEAPDLDAQVSQARATLAQSEQQLAQSRASLENAIAQEDLARTTWQRYQVLVQHGAVSRQDADQQLANYRTAQANVHLQEASVHTNEENVKASRANLERMIALQAFEHVTAPFSGVITARNFDVGAFINAAGASSTASTQSMGGTQAAAQLGNAGGNGTSPSQGSSPSSPTSTGAPAAGSGGELFRIAQIDTVRILVNVPQDNAPTVHPGQPASLFLQAFSKTNFSGKVTRTSSSLDQNTRTLLTEVQVPNPQFLLLPGMYAEVRFADLRSSPPLLIPGDAVLTSSNGLEVAVLQNLTQQDRERLQQEAEKQHQKNDQTQDQQHDLEQARRIHLQKVEVGRDYGTEMEISSGLEGWEHVVVNPGDNVAEGAIVIPRAAPAVAGQNAQQRADESQRKQGGIGSPSMEAPTKAPPTQKGGKGDKGGGKK